ncbi:uncharacterized protein C15orf41 homolog [Scaptodrosophila lebanonensis]|uniref:CDAN1-interacting nuclease 1 n=1 Tax=Drosophila lebanonensis TaxID=7225 RepID=A0A6J2UI06_DROLE|nr:uncharacterized protein C15orf41 homolog [Scaptodrosophila lebanonensis]
MMSESQPVASATPPSKKKILSNEEHARICQFINSYHGLPLDCELEMVQRIFPDVEHLTLTCILQTEIFSKTRSQHWRSEQRAKQLLQTYEDQCHLYKDNTLLIRMAVVENMSPVALSRIVLQEKYDLRQKSQISRLLRYPHLIEDPRLAANVQQCLCSDNQEGPITDLRRRIVGEEYELKMKQLAKAAGMHYYDEQDLRRMGYDKTPDIKMILPFLYKGAVVNWIESKANFGDLKSHKWNIQQQLHSYCNRFGPGIIIYWFGYHEETPKLTENNIGITVLADFPATDDLVLLHLTEPATSKYDQSVGSKNTS